MATNKLYTLSYFRKRLLDEGITSKVLLNKFSTNDKRYWLISIDNVAMIQCICFKYIEEGILKYYFQFQDGNQTIKYPVVKQTESMQVIISYLKEILNKG